MNHSQSPILLIPRNMMNNLPEDRGVLLVAIRYGNRITLLPCIDESVVTQSENDWHYRKGYLSGLSDGYHKGFSDALAAEALFGTYEKDST